MLGTRNWKVRCGRAQSCCKLGLYLQDRRRHHRLFFVRVTPKIKRSCLYIQNLLLMFPPFILSAIDLTMPTGKQTSPSSQIGSSTAFPKLVAFDLDYTLWDLWIDTHVTGPFKRTGEELNKVIPRRGDPISFYPDVPEILHKIRRNEDSYIAACSRTSAPDYAREVLGLLLVPPPKTSPKDEPKRAIEFFDGKEIYPGSKLKHFKRLHEKTGIPYEEMLFFDDESRNKEVESLGVTMILVPSTGTTMKLFEEGLKTWRKKWGR